MMKRSWTLRQYRIQINLPHTNQLMSLIFCPIWKVIDWPDFYFIICPVAFDNISEWFDLSNYIIDCITCKWSQKTFILIIALIIGSGADVILIIVLKRPLHSLAKNMTIVFESRFGLDFNLFWRRKLILI